MYPPLLHVYLQSAVYIYGKQEEKVTGLNRFFRYDPLFC